MEKSLPTNVRGSAPNEAVSSPPSSPIKKHRKWRNRRIKSVSDDEQSTDTGCSRKSKGFQILSPKKALERKKLTRKCSNEEILADFLPTWEQPVSPGRSRITVGGRSGRDSRSCASTATRTESGTAVSLEESVSSAGMEDVLLLVQDQDNCSASSGLSASLNRIQTDPDLGIEQTTHSRSSSSSIGQSQAQLWQGSINLTDVFVDSPNRERRPHASPRKKSPSYKQDLMKMVLEKSMYEVSGYKSPRQADPKKFCLMPSLDDSPNQIHSKLPDIQENDAARAKRLAEEQQEEEMIRLALERSMQDVAMERSMQDFGFVAAPSSTVEHVPRRSRRPVSNRPATQRRTRVEEPASRSHQQNRPLTSRELLERQEEEMLQRALEQSRADFENSALSGLS